MRTLLFLVPVLMAQAAPAELPSKALERLLHESDEAALKRDPISALYRGDYRYAPELGDLFGPERSERLHRISTTELARLRSIDRATLDETDQVAFDAFQWQLEMRLIETIPAMRALIDVRPVDHFYGIQTWYPELASGLGIAPFETVTDYEANIARHRRFPEQIDQAILRLREGVKTGILQPKVVVRHTIDQLTQQVDATADASPYLRPLASFPPGVPMAERERLTSETRLVIEQAVQPAISKFRNFLADEYLPQARNSVGLLDIKGGRLLYAYLIRYYTTSNMSAEDIHALGLSEVTRIRAEMEAIKTRVSFLGSLPAFFEHVRSDPRFSYRSADEMAADFAAIGRRVDARVGEQFAFVPQTRLDLRPTPPERAATASSGTYYAGTPDGKRPGIFYFNAYKPQSRLRLESETLYLHEAVPGHHFQISLARENKRLPAFLRFSENTAFVEGWGLYAETLWAELGVQTDPYARFGGLNKEMTRAMRLVVDTGLHAKGWSREQAIAYMLANSSMSRENVTAEVDRYIADPGQALAYKVGELTISRLKEKARNRLGTRFDPRLFHEQVLMTGAIPLTVLEAKIDRWIKREAGLPGSAVAN